MGNVIEPLSIGQSAKDYLSKEVNPTLLAGLTELCKKKPGDAVTWLADWLIDNNPNKPSVKDPIITVASLFSLLSFLSSSLSVPRLKFCTLSIHSLSSFVLVLIELNSFFIEMTLLSALKTSCCGKKK